jgi:hypothetical protein
MLISLRVLLTLDKISPIKPNSPQDTETSSSSRSSLETSSCGLQLVLKKDGAGTVDEPCHHREAATSATAAAAAVRGFVRKGQIASDDAIKFGLSQFTISVHGTLPFGFDAMTIGRDGPP